MQTFRTFIEAAPPMPPGGPADAPASKGSAPMGAMGAPPSMGPPPSVGPPPSMGGGLPPPSLSGMGPTGGGGATDKSSPLKLNAYNVWDVLDAILS